MSSRTYLQLVRLLRPLVPAGTRLVLEIDPIVPGYRLKIEGGDKMYLKLPLQPPYPLNELHKFFRNECSSRMAGSLVVGLSGMQFKDLYAIILA